MVLNSLEIVAGEQQLVCCKPEALVWRRDIRVCRYTLYQVKEELLETLGLNTEEEGSALQFLRRGYKTSVWWEDADDIEKSDAWRT
jgi:hypothetical protein